MIGIIGPEDTTALIERIADELNLGSTIVTAKYQSSDETINLVKTLIPICQIILFSGILPYKIALSAGFNKEILDFIPHGGTDLFRTIALTALNNDKIGHIPKFSFDCIPIHDVQEAYDELNLIDDYHVIPLDADCASAPPNIERMIATHRSLYAAGKIDYCATCIRSIFERLSDAKLPVIRINHSRASVRQSLLRAKLRHDLIQAEAAHVAICVLSPLTKAADGAVSQQIKSAAHKLSDLLGCRFLKPDGHEVVLLTTKRAIDQHLRPDPTLTETLPDFIVGVGIGPHTDFAETQARQAHQKARLKTADRFQIEQTVFAYATLDPDNLRQERQIDLGIAQNLHVSPAVIRRLGAVFREIDPNGFTAVELAQSYNFLPRSARRLLTLLKERGFVEECGQKNHTGAGRPQVIYKIFLDRILFPG